MKNANYVNKIKHCTLPENYLLITLDVESMYTNINHVKALPAVRKVMTHCQSSGSPLKK